MILIAVVALCVLSVPMAGGRLSALGSLRVRLAWLLVAAVAVQTVVISFVPDAPPPLPAAGHLLSYGLTAAFVLANLRLPGLWLVGLGGGLNLAAIAANGGVMPASPAALAVAGRSAHTAGFSNSTAVPDARLAFLGDVFAVPAGWPLANVFSIGDVLLVIGLLVAVHRLCGSALVPRHWRLAQGPTVARPRPSPLDRGRAGGRVRLRPASPGRGSPSTRRRPAGRAR